MSSRQEAIPMMSSRQEAIPMILRYLKEENLHDSVHMLESESGLFLSERYITEQLRAGNFEEIKLYVRRFNRVNVDDASSESILFQVAKLRFLEYLQGGKKTEAALMFMHDLRGFPGNKELADLCTFDNLRDSPTFSEYNIQNQREHAVLVIRGIINQNPFLREKRLSPKVEQGGSLRNILSLKRQSETAVPLAVDLPTKVVVRQGHEPVTSMDFHPVRNNLLLVGSVTGAVTLYDLAASRKLLSQEFSLWFPGRLSQGLKDLVSGQTNAVARVLWSPEGTIFAAAFKQSIVQLCTFVEGCFFRHLEVEAHKGAVNDISFVEPPDKKLSFITCGEDCLIKVWDLDGWVNFTFKGHNAPVFSICPHERHNVKFILSTDTSGELKVWLYKKYDSQVLYKKYDSEVTFNTPDKCTAKLLYSADGERLFLCGTTVDGKSHLVVLNEDNGSIINTYLGLKNQSIGVVMFDASRDEILAVGEENLVKFWKMESTDLLAKTDAEGGLQPLSSLRFNKEGSLLAVTTTEGFKVLGNKSGIKSLTNL